MTAWRDDQLDVLLEVKDEQQVLDRVTSLTRELGFEHCAYGIRAPLPVASPRVRLFNTYPDAWQKRYTQHNYVTVDPTVRHAVRSSRPVLWREELFVDARELWEEARAQGLCYGLAQPCRDAYGVRGMLTVARSHEPLTDAELQQKGPQLAWLTQMTHTAMTRVVVGNQLPQPSKRLSDREREILGWTADGKTTPEIAQILALTERTVNFHMSNILKKLDAPNKTAAVMRAALLGILY